MQIKRNLQRNPFTHLVECVCSKRGFLSIFTPVTLLYCYYIALSLPTGGGIGGALGSLTNDDGTKPSAIITKPGLTCAESQSKVASGDWADPNHGQIYSRLTTDTIPFHIAVHNEKYDPVRWRIIDEGTYYEADVVKHFVQILSGNPRSVVLDVGANIGYYTLLSASLGHDVVSFEPNPANLLRLCESLKLNNWGHDRVSLFQVGVSDVHGEERTLHAPKNPGAGFLRPIDPDKDGMNDEHRARTSLITLDKFAEEQGWFQGRTDDDNIQISILKIDIEGLEPFAVAGASKLLKSGFVQNVMMECRRFGRPKMMEMFETLFEAGYTVKVPPIQITATTPKAMAIQVKEYYTQRLGKRSGQPVDLWWVKT